ncbi:hypothetical protein R8Z50_16120 [Longispora sp. K20-0274]|uniref:hypothetical protein n=1 Tax=Longispora sp. K20-0274 TaxID=3088255 RepID=UPI0039995BD4
MDIREIFEARLADLPPSAVDLDRAVGDARRTRRTRRVLTTVAASLCLVVAATVAVWQSPHPPGPEPSLADGYHLREAPVEFDPRLQFARLEWLPEGLEVRFLSATPGSLHLASRANVCTLPPPCGGGSTGHDPAGRFAFTALAAGAADPQDALDEPVTTPAPAVHGAAANWITRSADGAGVVRLRWQYAPRAWAQVEVQLAGDVADPKAVVHRIAEGARFGTTDPIRLPVTVDLSEKKIMSVQLDTADPWQAVVAYRRTGPPGTDFTTLSVGTGSDRGAVRENTTVDGHPAGVSRSVVNSIGQDALTVFDVRGLTVSVVVTGREPDQIPPEGTAAAVFRGLVLYPDRADWR